MPTIDQQISEIEKEIKKTPYHKGTERHHGLLRAKISKLKAKREAAATRGSSGRGISYAVKKQGDATICLVGPPSAGKSTLLNLLTNAESKVAPYAFTTVSVIPGMMTFNDANIQILDVPGLIEGAEEGKGRGREVLSVVRACDLLILMSDTDRPEALQRIADTLHRNNIRINSSPPNVTIQKKLKGGIIIHSNIKQSLDKQTIKNVANELGIKNAEISIKQRLTLEKLIDAFSKNRVYVPALFVLNKSDIKKSKLKNIIYISAENKTNINKLKKAIWKNLNLTRVYLIRKDDKPSKNNPLIIKKGSTLKEVAEIIGTEFSEGKKKAKIWGPGAKFPAQQVSLKTKAIDDMQIRFV